MEHLQHPIPHDIPPGRQQVFGTDPADGIKTTVWLTCNTEFDLIRLVIGEESVDLSPDKAIRIARALILCDHAEGAWDEAVPTLCKSRVKIRNTAPPHRERKKIEGVVTLAISVQEIDLHEDAVYDLAFFLIDAARFLNNVANAFWDPKDVSTWDRVCRVCGCSDESACEQGCTWRRVPKNEEPLCSACADHPANRSES